MSTADRIRELDELAEKYCDGELTESDQRQLTKLLRSDEQLQRRYLAYIQLHASLWLSHGQRRLEDPSTSAAGRAHPDSNARVRRSWSLLTSQPGPTAVAVATVVVSLLIIAMAFMVPPFYRAMTGSGNDGSDASPRHEFVAELTDTHQAVWVEGQVGTHRGAHLTTGRRIELKEGLVEITFRSGAVVILKGPSVLVVLGDKLSELQRGELSAKVPPAAKGFSVHTPVVRIEDLGTEFAVSVADDGATDVDVFQGKVVADIVDTQGKVLSRHDLTKDAAVSVSANAKIVKPRVAQQSEFVTAMPIRPLRVDFQHTGTCRTQRGFLPFTEADADSGRTYQGPHGPLHVGITGEESSINDGFFGRNQLANHGRFTYADLYNDFAFHNGGGALSLTITGVQPNVEYKLRLFCSDLVTDGPYAQQQTNALVIVGDTAGENAQVTFDRTSGPQSNAQHCAELKVKSTTNTLSIAVNAEVGSLTRLNGFELSIPQQRGNATNK